jgi:hypothetical protein
VPSIGLGLRFKSGSGLASGDSSPDWRAPGGEHGGRCDASVLPGCGDADGDISVLAGFGLCTECPEPPSQALRVRLALGLVGWYLFRE